MTILFERWKLSVYRESDGGYRFTVPTVHSSEVINSAQAIELAMRILDAEGYAKPKRKAVKK